MDYSATAFLRYLSLRTVMHELRGGFSFCRDDRKK